MSEAYVLQAATEALNGESIKLILNHYTSAEVATAGIFSSKWFDRRALENAGLFSNAEENFYYRRIYSMVSSKIMPKIFDVATLMIKYPEKAIYWGPYLYKVCEQTKQLCMIFETVVGNGKISFKDIPFLVINDDLRSLFDLSKLYDVDWDSVWDDLAEFGSDVTKEDLLDDLEGLMTAGGSIASAGVSLLDSAWITASNVGGILHKKPGEVIQLYDEFKDMYETYSDPVNVKNLLLATIHSTDSTGVANLFKVDGYNISSYVSDYIKEMQGQYYTQRWYIYWKDSGSECVCNYSPPTDNYGILNSGEWYRVTTSDASYIYTASDYENSLSNSEGYAGWSRSLCEELNRADDYYVYTFSNNIAAARILGGSSGSVKAYVYAHYIKVYKTWDIYEEVYEELFDSQYDSEEAIMARFTAKLQSLNCNEQGRVYRIGKDSKNYYTAADENKMVGCASVSFTMECDESGQLCEGNFSWKENGDQRNALDENSKIFAMESTLSGTPDYTEIDEKISYWSGLVSSYTHEIQALNDVNDDLLAQISRSSVKDAAVLRAQYYTNLNRINDLKEILDYAKTQLASYQAVKQQMVDDYADERDGTYRIPAVMHELESAYNISWSDEGSWEGWVFIRHGTLPNINGELEFKAELTKERGESRFLGIRFHRAILAVHWTLTANYSSSEIVDYMELDNSLTDAEKADIVNQRLHELMEAHPSCSVEANYAYSSPQEVDPDEDAVHLLWVSQRLAVAREVDYRLSKIYAQLVLAEKFMRTRETLLDYLKQAIGIYVLNGTDHTRLGNKSFRRWRRSATAVSVGENKEDVLAAMDDDDDV